MPIGGPFYVVSKLSGIDRDASMSLFRETSAGDVLVWKNLTSRPVVWEGRVVFVGMRPGHGGSGSINVLACATSAGGIVECDRWAIEKALSTEGVVDREVFDCYKVGQDIERVSHGIVVGYSNVCMKRRSPETLRIAMSFDELDIWIDEVLGRKEGPVQ